MRMFLLALMIALLPLRGWLGDVMAIEQVGQARTAAHTSDLHSDCHEAQLHHGQLDATHEGLATGSEQGPVQAAGDCTGCTACQICHSVALAGPFSLTPTAAPATSAPQTQARLHASIARAPGFKPPIS
jgi:hypothetical protein